MNNWTPRQISGATLAGIGVLALLVQPHVMKLVSGASPLVVGACQAGLAVVGLGGTLIGIYRLATKDKK
jgi:hypothetical protein